ncbi:MAG: helix-turn-helix domain-containing protein [Comamonadaceae bacterium]|nr:MAG: helix-turn-helix domain-containing protein [Comamonadaceae bacterium]
MRHKVFLYLLEQFVLIDVVGPLQVFAAADEILVARGGVAAYKAQLYASRAGAVASSSGVLLRADALPGHLAHSAGSLILVGGYQGLLRPDAIGRRRHPAAGWLEANAHRFGRIGSIGKDAYLLVHAARSRFSLFDTGHAERVQKNEIVKPRPSAAPQRWMSANASAGVELALAMVRNDLGENVALEVAASLAEAYGRRILLRLGGSFTSDNHADRRLDALHGWMEDHLREPLPVTRLAEQMAMTPRTFARYYERSTGRTPAQSVLRLRLERACMLIASSPGLTLKAISLQCGFSSEEVMRRAFVRVLHMSPKAYRLDLAEEDARLRDASRSRPRAS